MAGLGIPGPVVVSAACAGTPLVVELCRNANEDDVVGIAVVVR